MNRLGKYQIRRTLGKGAMGIVYEGFDPVIERTVAIKTILPSQLSGGEFAEVMARFKREAQAAGRLSHQGIVAIYDYGEEIASDVSEDDATMMASPTPAQNAQRVAYIAMEFVKGRELRDLFTHGERLPLPEAARIICEVLDALDHAHAQGVVHRDIKPANLILLDNGHVKVADFGIARLETSELTQTGAVLGTPSYMSPEQFMGQPVDGRSDLFSCGVVLYQLLTGERPFTGESTTTIMYKVLREEPVPPSQLNMALEPALDAVVKRALAKNPNERFQSGRDFAQALRAAVAGEAAASQPSSHGQSAQVRPPQGPGASTPAVSVVPPTMAAAAPAEHHHLSAGHWVAVAASVVAVGAGAYLFASHSTSAPPAVLPAPAPVTAPVSASATTEPPAANAEPGTMVISALGMVDPADSRFKGDAGAAQLEARAEARRQLVEKALALYVEPGSLKSHHDVIERTLLASSGSFIRSVLQEGTTDAAKSGLVEMPTRAVVNVRAVQKSLNELSRGERIDFIRKQGDPRISIRIDIALAEGAALGRDRSQLAENVVKDRIKAFGFRVWSAEGDNPDAASAQPADFAIKGEIKLKQLSTKLPASGLTITKTVLSSWTLKAIDTASGEEVYLSTRLPSGQSWGSQDQALGEIGKLVGDEFSRDFFLSHFSFRPQPVTLVFSGLPEGGAALMLRELRSLRAVLDAQSLAEGRFLLQLPPGNASDIVQDTVLRPLNTKLGTTCFTIASAAANEMTIAVAATCANAKMRSKLETEVPAGMRAAAAAKMT